MSQYSEDTISKYVTKPAVAFGIGAAIGAFMHPDTTIELSGRQVPLWAFAGSAAAIGVGAGSVFNDYVAPQITSLTLLSAPMHTAANVGLVAGSTALAYQMIAGEGWSSVITLPELLGAAAVIEVGSAYANEHLLRPMLSGMRE